MIKVRVQNFQSIEDAEITISGLTVITGTNNAGKSALFRAIRGAFTNTKGFDFVRIGKSQCTVSLDFGDNQTLQWEKGAKVNSYTVNGKELKKIGFGVPPEARVFGVNPVSVLDNDLWPQIAPQITGITFLVDQPGSVIAEAVADVTRVNRLTKALKASESDKRSTKSDLKLRIQDKKSLEKSREEYQGLDLVVEEVAALIQKKDSAEKLAKGILNLERFRTRLHAARKEVASLEGLNQVHILSDDIVQRASDTLKEWVALDVQKTRYRQSKQAVECLLGLETVGEIIPTDDRLEYIQKIRSALSLTSDLARRWQQSMLEVQQVSAGEKALQTVDLDEVHEIKALKFPKAMETIKTMASKRRQATKELEVVCKDLEKLESELNQIESHLTGLIGQDCPTCGQMIQSL